MLKCLSDPSRRRIILERIAASGVAPIAVTAIRLHGTDAGSYESRNVANGACWVLRRVIAQLDAKRSVGDDCVRTLILEASRAGAAAAASASLWAHLPYFLSQGSQSPPRCLYLAHACISEFCSPDRRRFRFRKSGQLDDGCDERVLQLLSRSSDGRCAASVQSSCLRPSLRL